MGALRQPARQPVTTYGIQDDAFAREDEGRQIITERMMLLVFFVALAVATLWFVGRPVLSAPSTPQRGCDRVVVHDSGAATCVTKSGRVVRVG
jgi:cytochrome bd-type quinol oxidase subunit 1